MRTKPIFTTDIFTIPKFGYFEAPTNKFQIKMKDKPNKKNQKRQKKITTTVKEETNKKIATERHT